MVFKCALFSLLSMVIFFYVPGPFPLVLSAFLSDLPLGNDSRYLFLRFPFALLFSIANSSFVLLFSFNLWWAHISSAFFHIAKLLVTVMCSYIPQAIRIASSWIYSAALLFFKQLPFLSDFSLLSWGWTAASLLSNCQIFPKEFSASQEVLLSSESSHVSLQ